MTRVNRYRTYGMTPEWRITNRESWRFFCGSQVILFAEPGDGSATLTPMPGRFHAGLSKGHVESAFPPR